MPDRIRLMDEHSSDWPVWTDFEGQENRPEWGFSADLVRDLKFWALDFEAHYSHITGWKTQSHRENHVAEGQRLQADIQTAVGSNFYVELVVMTND